MILLIELICLALLFALSAFFSSSESALFSLDPIQTHRLVEKHPVSGRRIDKALTNPTRLLSAILVGNTLANVAASALGYAVLGRLLSARAALVAIPVMTFLLLVFGEISPKRLALRYPAALALLYAVPLDWFVRAMLPFTALLAWVSNLAHEALTPSPRLTEDEYRTALIDSETRGLLDPEERTIVEGIIRLEQLSVTDVMTPRVDIVGVQADADRPEVLVLARKSQYKFLPVYQGTLDEITGFLDVRHFLLNQPCDMTEVVKDPEFVPSSMSLDSLAVMFQNESRRIACVVDEYGGTAGIVTKGDVMEEIIRDTEPRGVREGEGIMPLSQRQWLVGGDTSLEDVNNELGLDLNSEGVSRISGLVAAELQHIPERGDTVELETCRIVVRGIQNLRVRTVFIERKIPAAVGGDGQ